MKNAATPTGGSRASSVLDVKLAEVDKLRAQVAVPDTRQVELTRLREAAALLGQNGKNDMCVTLADSMQESLQDRREVNQKAREEQQKVAHLTAAKPLFGVVRAGKVIGSEVQNIKAEKLGTIENIAIDAATGQVAYAVMAHGGFDRDNWPSKLDAERYWQK